VELGVTEMDFSRECGAIAARRTYWIRGKDPEKKLVTWCGGLFFLERSTVCEFALDQSKARNSAAFRFDRSAA